MIINFQKKYYIALIIILISVIGFAVIHLTKTTRSATDSCCYNECNIGDVKCVGNIAFKCCPDCDSDPYQDWCAPDCVNPNGQDCALTGQICDNGECIGAPLTCSDGTFYYTCSATALYCNGSGDLVNDCVNCPCTGGWICTGGTVCNPPCVSNGCNNDCPVNCTGTDDPDCPGACMDCTCLTDIDCSDSCTAGDGCCAGCSPADPDCCIPNLTCADYTGQCGVNLSDGCTNSLDCSGNCSVPQICCAGVCQDPVCVNNSDCLDDGDNCTAEVCDNPNTCAANCSHNLITACGPDEGCCPAVCDISSDINCCGSDGSCDGICPANCNGADDPDCDCTVGNTCCGINCTNATDSDCLLTCGTNGCESGEDCVNCSIDCGECPPTCPDGVCNEGCGECFTCLADCYCGGGYCGCGETSVSCPADCSGSCPNTVCDVVGGECSTCAADCACVNVGDDGCDVAGKSYCCNNWTTDTTAGEVCDVADGLPANMDLNGKICADFGYTGGILSCRWDCKVYDFSSCTGGCTDECSLLEFGCDGLDKEWVCGEAGDGDICLEQIITDCNAGETCNPVSGVCEISSTGNTKLLSKYSNNQIFLIPDDNWQEVMSLVSLTTWTAQDAGEYASCHHVYNGAPNVCAYPNLIYHKEAADTFDADSILHFMDQYSANEVIAVNSLPTELAGHINGKGITPDIISINDYLSYWSNYDEVVYVQNNYQLALIASTFASLKNAPLVVQGTSLDVAGTFSGKIVYTIGSLVCPASAGSCVNFANVQALEQEYFNLTNTDKLVLVNYDDLGLNLDDSASAPYGGINSYYSSNNFFYIYANQSLSASILASAKHELIISTNAIDYLTIDSFIENKIAVFSMSPEYLTVIAFPDAIQMSKDNSGHQLLDRQEVDSSFYGNIDADLYPELSVGRIFSITSSDVSSYISRSLFYNSIPHSNNFSMLWPNYFAAMKFQGKSIDALYSAAGLNEESIYYDEGYSSMDLNRDMENKFYINYLDHGNQVGYVDTIKSSSLLSNNIQMHPSLIFSEACLTCAYEKANAWQRKYLYCAHTLRNGAIMHIGAIEETYNDKAVSKQIAEKIALGKSIGGALKELKSAVLASHKIQPWGAWRNEEWLVLLGDPTFKVNAFYPGSANKVNISEDIGNKILEFEIPEISSKFDYEELFTGSVNNHGFIPPFSENALRHVFTWRDNLCYSGYAEYHVKIQKNYTINDINTFTFINDSGAETDISVTDNAFTDSDIKKTTSLFALDSNFNQTITITIDEDELDNEYHIIIKGSYPFVHSANCAIYNTLNIPAHSYRITFN